MERESHREVAQSAREQAAHVAAQGREQAQAALGKAKRQGWSKSRSRVLPAKPNGLRWPCTTPLPDLIADLTRETTVLVLDEVHLARAELPEKVDQATNGIASVQEKVSQAGTSAAQTERPPQARAGESGEAAQGGYTGTAATVEPGPAPRPTADW